MRVSRKESSGRRLISLYVGTGEKKILLSFYLQVGKYRRFRTESGIYHTNPYLVYGGKGSKETLTIPISIEGGEGLSQLPKQCWREEGKGSFLLK